MKLFKLFPILALAPILLHQTAAAQTGAEERLMKFAGNIHQFNSIFPQEKVYLQFDNTSYYSGETIWFKAFVVSASNLQRAQSKVLYVDLVSPEGVVLKQQKLKISAGQADGSLTLLDGSTAQARELRGVTGYPSGFYEVRAYTAYMQNFSEDNIYSRVFAVYDRPKTDGAYYDSNPTITLRNIGVQKKRPETPKQHKINAEFLPEGGHMVIGLPCRVAFRISGENGLGTDASVSLDEGEDMAFRTVHDGMGSFTFTPAKRHNSVKVTVADGTSRTFQLPEAETEGCSMLADASGDSLSISLAASGIEEDPLLGITIVCRGELYDFQTVDISTGKAVQTFDTQAIPEGVYRATVFNASGDILASRSFYHRNSRLQAPEIKVTSDRSNYAPFQKISLQFTLKDGNGVPFRDRFSVSVRDSRSQGNAMIDDIRSSLLLASDLKGFIEHPDWYFQNNDSERDMALDLLCMIHGWERYDWRTMAGINEYREKHRQEKSLTLNGWIYSPTGGKPMEGAEVGAAVMPVDKSLSETFSLVTDSSGYFGFDLGSEFYDKARLSISATPDRKRKVGTSARILLERSITPAVRAFYPAETQFGQVLRKVSTDNGISVEKPDDGLATVINIETGYLLPDVEIDEHRKYIDYYTFNAFDVISDVEKDLDKGEYTTDVIGYLIEKGYQVLSGIAEDGTDSLESINGFEPFLYVHDSHKFRNTGIFEYPAKIDTKDIKGIMVYDHPLYKQEAWLLAPLYIEYINNHIENLEGRDDKYDRVVMVDILLKDEGELATRKEIYKTDRRTTTIDGYSRPYSFYAPEYPEGPIFGDVDYRRTLYWNPNVVTDSIGQADVEFYNSSITTHFNVNAAGITAGGQPYSLDLDF